MLRGVGRAVAVVTAGGCAGGGYFWYEYKSLPPVDSALQPGKTLTCKLLSVEPLTRDTARYRFELPTKRHALGLPCASHVVAVDGANVGREYTPTTLDALDRGYFDLVVKRYANGYFSDEVFSRMRPGVDSLGFRGPVTTLPYARGAADELCLIAGGTGITPMYQIMRTALRDPLDRTRLRLLYANRSVDDILLRDEIDALAAAHPARLRVQYVVQEDPRRPETGGRAAPFGRFFVRWWRRRLCAADDGHAAASSNAGGVTTGIVDAAAIARFLPTPDAPRTAFLVCGPPGMMAFLCGPAPPRAPNGARAELGGLMRELGYRNQVVRFD